MTDGELIMKHISTYVDKKIELNELELRPADDFLDPVVFPPSFIERSIEVERNFIAGCLDD